MKILVTGANGQLGSELRALAPAYPSHEFIFCTKSELAIDQPESIREQFEKSNPAICINCAAYTAVDKAESEKDLAFRINGFAVGALAAACRIHGTRFIHISTDYVFDGLASWPLKEEDPTSPLNVYGASKLEGERLAMQENPDTLIIRTAWVYSSFGSNFVKTMIRLMKEKKSIRVVNDQIGSPTYAGDLAKLLLQIAQSGKFIPGIYHYSNEGRISWYEFALAIRELIHSDCEILAVPSAEYPTVAKRPHYSLLDKSKIKAVYGIDIPHWKTSLALCIKKINEESV